MAKQTTSPKPAPAQETRPTAAAMDELKAAASAEAAVRERLGVLRTAIERYEREPAITASPNTLLEFRRERVGLLQRLGLAIVAGRLLGTAQVRGTSECEELTSSLAQAWEARGDFDLQQLQRLGELIESESTS